MTEEDAYTAFCGIRWPDGQRCPYCGSPEFYSITTRRKFKCIKCGRQYSATSGTAFHSRKLTYAEMMRWIEIGVGIGSIAVLAREMGVQYRTAFEWRHRKLPAVASLHDGRVCRGQPSRNQ